jgi:hypothetical protein
MTRKLTNGEYAQPVVPVDADGVIINPASPTVTVDLGTKIDSETLEAGGAGLIGWMASVRKAVATTLLNAIIAILGATNDAAVGDGTGTINAHLRQIAKTLAAGIGVTGTFYQATQPVSGTVAVSAISAGETHLGETGGKSVVVGDETTRPADTTAYTAGDAVSATVSDTGTTVLRSLAVGRVAGGSGYLTKFRVMTDQAACVAAIRLHFYSVNAPASVVVGDNVAMTIKYANKAQRLGHVDLPAMATSTVAGSSDAAIAQELDIRFQFKCANGDQNIYYRYETLTTFTPNSGQKFYLEVAAEQD